MANVRIPHVINYKDFFYYDDETEYLKRFYNRDEVKARMGNITSFYFNLTEGNVRINFPLQDQFIIIQKRNEQHAKLILSKLQNLTEAPQTQRDVNINQNEEAGRNIQEGPKPDLVDKQEKNPSNEVEKVPQKIIALKKSEELIIERAPAPKEKEEPLNQSYENILPSQQELVAISFESITHDIYYPAFSIEVIPKEPSTDDFEKKKPNFNRRKDFKGDGFLETPAVPQISGAQIKKMQQALLQAEAEEGGPQITEVGMESPYARIFQDEPLMLFKGNKKDLLRGTREVPKEKPKEKSKEPEKKIEYSLTNSVSFSKKDIFTTDTETKVPKQQVTNIVKEIEKQNEDVLSDRQIVGILSSPKEEKNTNVGTGFVFEKRREVKEEVVIKQSEPFSTQVHLSEDKSLKAPMITIKNIQINQIQQQVQKPLPQAEEVEQVNGEIDQNNQTSHFAKTIQIENIIPTESEESPGIKPSLGLKPSPDLKASPEAKTSHDGQNSSDYKPSPEIQSKPADTIFSEESSEQGTKATDATPKTSSEYVKELMKKHYKLSDGGVGLNQPITERFKESSIIARLTEAKKKAQEQQQNQSNNRNMYKNSTLRSSLNQEIPNSLKGRANTEANIFHNIAVARSLHKPQNSLYNYNPQSTPRHTNSPSSNTKRRLKSNEGVVLLTQESSTSNPMSSRRSPETTKSIGEFQNDILQSLNKNYDAVKMLDQKKAEYKHHNKSKSSSNYLQSKGSFKINPTIELDQFPGEALVSTRSQQGNYTSPYGSNKYNLKLDLGYMSPNGKIDTNHGFLSGRSRNGLDSDVRVHNGKSPAERYAVLANNKDYFLSHKYNKTEESQGYTKTDESRSKTRDLTGSISTLGHITDRNLKQSPRAQGSTNKVSKSPTVNYPDQKTTHKKTIPNSSRGGSISYQNNKQVVNKKGGKY